MRLALSKAERAARKRHPLGTTTPQSSYTTSSIVARLFTPRQPRAFLSNAGRREWPDLRSLKCAHRIAPGGGQGRLALIRNSRRLVENASFSPTMSRRMLDRSALVAFIARRQVCGPCMTTKFKAAIEVIETELRRSGSLTLLKITPGRCDECGRTSTIFSVPADA